MNEAGDSSGTETGDETADASVGGTGHGSEERFDEVREAAGAVLVSLKWLVEATERVLDDPENLTRIVERGRSVVDAFVGGFADGANRDDPEAEPPEAETAAD